MFENVEKWATYLFEKFGSDKAIDYLCDQEDKASRSYMMPSEFYNMTYKLKQRFSKLKRYTTTID